MKSPGSASRLLLSGLPPEGRGCIGSPPLWSRPLLLLLAIPRPLPLLFLLARPLPLPEPPVPCRRPRESIADARSSERTRVACSIGCMAKHAINGYGNRK